MYKTEQVIQRTGSAGIGSLATRVADLGCCPEAVKQHADRQHIAAHTQAGPSGRAHGSRRDRGKLEQATARRRVRRLRDVDVAHQAVCGPVLARGVRGACGRALTQGLPVQQRRKDQPGVGGLEQAVARCMHTPRVPRHARVL